MTQRRNNSSGSFAMFAAMRRLGRGSPVLSPLLMQLKEEHSCEDLRAEHARFDLRRHRAPIVRGDGNHSVAYVELARYAFAVGVLEADFFTHY
jgi:hypothetical protein